MPEHSTPIHLGSGAPLVKAASVLLDRPVDALGEVDLSRVLVVVPGARAGRQFLLALVAEAEGRGIRFVPPRTTTPSELVFSMRGRPAQPVADRPLHRGVLAAVLGAADADTLAGVIRPDADWIERFTVADALLDADRTVAAAGRDWADVVSTVERSVELGGESDRYRRIESLLARAEADLGNLGWLAPETAKRLLVEAGLGASDEVEGTVAFMDAPEEVVLLGVVDLSARDEAVLAGCTVHTMILAAPPAGGDALPDARLDPRFDAIGRVAPAHWIATPPVIPLASLQIEDKPIDEAEAVVEMLASAADAAEGGRLDPESVAIVVADETAAESFRREIEAAGVTVHLAGGRAFARSGLARTLGTLAIHLNRRDSDGFGRLVADPAFAAAIGRRLDGLDAAAAWSRWAESDMPRPLADGWPGDPDAGERADQGTARRTLHAADAVVTEILAPLGVTATDRLDRMLAGLLEVLQRLDDEDAAGLWSEEILRLVRDAVGELIALPEALQPTVTAAEAIRLLLGTLDPARLPDPPDPAAIETIGWLEAPFDPAGRVVVTGCHDAALPGRFTDPILPDSLRATMGLEDEARRHARDLWVLSTILGRDPDARFLVPRRDPRGEPHVPSRLIFGDRGPALARRVVDVFTRPSARNRGGVDVSGFGRPRPTWADDAARTVNIDRLSVTAFRDYLASPYRFWLKHVLGLRGPDPIGRELDARTFGTVLHHAVEVFGQQDIARHAAGERPCADPDRIHQTMVDAMSEAIDRMCGSKRGAGLLLQERILTARLRVVAIRQAELATEGWRIHAVEDQLDALLDIPGEAPMPVRGRIDRIDHHPEKGWRLIDFKTSDAGKRPDPSHRTKGRWIDLQLPLYRGLHAGTLPGAPAPAEVATGYFLVTPDPGKIGFAPSKKIDELHEEAMDMAREVVRNIRDGNFDLTGDPPWDGDPMALVQRTRSLGGEDDAEDEG
ncbi:MAG: hypothetical protein CMJ54_03515 [Planctomycetaceae bacterium]|nr:hypothetical protein [Planctomycetaceae bacterium]